MSILKSTYSGQTRVSEMVLPKIFKDLGIHHEVFVDEQNRVCAKLWVENKNPNSRNTIIRIKADEFPCRPVFEGKPEVELVGFRQPCQFEKLPSISELRDMTSEVNFVNCEFAPEQFEFVWDAKDHIKNSYIYISHEIEYNKDYDEVYMSALCSKACYTQKFFDVLLQENNTIFVPEPLDLKFRGIYRPADKYFGNAPYEWKRIHSDESLCESKVWLTALWVKHSKERDRQNKLWWAEQQVANNLGREWCGHKPIPESDFEKLFFSK